MRGNLQKFVYDANDGAGVCLKALCGLFNCKSSLARSAENSRE